MLQYNLTKPQRLVYEMDKYMGGSIANIVGGILCSGIEMERLEKAIKAIIKNNDALRMQLVEAGSDPIQYVADFSEEEIAKKITFKKFENKEEMNCFFNEWAKVPLKISESLCEFYMVNVAGRNGCIAKMHHLISDAWTLMFIGNEIFKYAGLDKSEDRLNQQNPSYIEYIEKEKQYIASAKYEKDRKYWLDQFRQCPEATYISDKTGNELHSNRINYCIDGSRVETIKAYCIAEGCSVYSLFMAAIGIYISRLKGKEQFYLGTAILNRSGYAEKRTIGMFVNTAAVLMNIQPNARFNEVVKKVATKSADVFRHQKYQYGEVLKDLRQEYKFNEKLYDVMVSYQNAKISEESEFETNWYPCGMQCESLELHISDRESVGELALEYDYQISKFSEREIEQVHSHILNIIDDGIKNNSEVRKLKLLSDEEFEKIIYEVNRTDVDYPKDKTIIELFKEQVEKTPEHTAIEYKHEKMTYRELDRLSDALAYYLVNKGVGTEKIVGVFLPRSTELMISLLGILKAGGAYVPIDAGYGLERASYMLKDSDAMILITNDELKEKVTFEGEILTEIKQVCIENKGLIPYYTAKSDNLAYVIYTSGSTGQPKGVMLSNRSVVNYILWAAKQYLKGEKLSFALFTSISFDLTVTSLFTPLLTGNSMVIYGDELGAEAILEIVKDNKVGVVKLTPSHLKLIMNRDNSKSNIRRLILGGEQLECVCAQKTIDSFEGRVEIYNEYGPTEATVGCMIHLYNPDQDKGNAVPIGVPADNVKLYLLDPWLNPVGTFDKGELYIAGEGVARGYLNKEELTKKSFVNNPFEQGIMYKTGDIALWTGRFKMEFCGRCDEQVKIRGHRIELLEIENRLMQMSLVKQAVVVAPRKEDGEKYLCAYYVADQEIETQELYSFLKQYLSEYMVPAYYMRLDALPVTLNGKIDSGALPVVDFETQKSDYVSPQTRLETMLVEVFQEVLRIEPIGMKDSFFALGGDSIKAIQIVSRLGNLGIAVESKDILSQDILEQIVLLAKEDSSIGYPQKTLEGTIGETPIIRWFKNQQFEYPEYYCQTVVLRMEESTDVEKLNQTFDLLIQHFDTFRMNSKVDGLYYNNSLLDEHFAVEVMDLRELEKENQEDEFKQMCKRMKGSLSLEDDFPIKASLFHFADQTVLVIAAHHLVTDGVTWRVFAENLKEAYTSIMTGNEPKLSVKTASYEKWADALRDYAQTTGIRDYIQFWNTMQKMKHTLQGMGNGNENQDRRTQIVSGGLAETYTQKLLYQSNTAYNTSTEDLIVCALMRTLQKWTGFNRQTLEMEGHGRVLEGIDVSSTAGWFTAIYPVRLILESIDIGTQIVEIKEQLHHIPDGGIGYGVLKYFTELLEPCEAPEIRFNYLGVIDHPDYRVMDTGEDSSSQNTNRPKLDINCMVYRGELIYQLEYQTKYINKEKMEDFQELFNESLQAIISFTVDREETEFTASDFSVTQSDFDELFA